jgi:acyl-coenzyme A thioesterase PaaI-like protein
MPYQELLQRPGGTICGPALMALADVTLYGVVMSMIGEVPLAVTTDKTIHFLSRPSPRDVIATGRLLKLGRRLAVGEVTMCSDGDAGAICHVIGTYAIPPEMP